MRTKARTVMPLCSSICTNASSPMRCVPQKSTIKKQAHLEFGCAPVGAPRVARDGLLREEARGGDHRKAAVRELLLLHDAELRGVFGLDTERVEAEVARNVRRAHALEGGLRLGEGRLRHAERLSLASVRVGEAGLDTRRLSDADADG